MIEEESEQFRRNAALQGVDIPDSGDEDENYEQESLHERLARRKAEDQGEDPEAAVAKHRFGEGQGYTVI